MARCLVNLSSRACHVARIIRSESQLLSSVTERKLGEPEQTNAGADHKTLADVLIQEMVRHGIEQQIPQLSGNIFGEEDSTISVRQAPGLDGVARDKKVTIKVNGDRESLKNSLSELITNNGAFVESLTDAVYADPPQTQDPQLMSSFGSSPKATLTSTGPDTDHLDPENVVFGSKKVNMEDVAVWIDPLDGTNVYASRNGLDKKTTGGIAHSSLSCVTVLIGLFNKKTGEPLLGVVGKPFRDSRREDPKWLHAGYWGFTASASVAATQPPPVCRSISTYLASAPPPAPKVNPSRTAHPIAPPTPLTVVVGHSEDNSKFRKRLSEVGCRLVSSSGAGYKQMCVVLGLADLYVGSLANTSQWDTCAPHAILQGVGGGIVEYSTLLARMEDILRARDAMDRTSILNEIQLTYNPRSPAYPGGQMPKINDPTFPDSCSWQPEFNTFPLEHLNLANVQAPPTPSPNEFKHKRGLVAYRSLEKLMQFLPYLQQI